VSPFIKNVLKKTINLFDLFASGYGNFQEYKEDYETFAQDRDELYHFLDVVERLHNIILTSNKENLFESEKFIKVGDEANNKLVSGYEATFA
jgi:hypothetical protein